MESAKMSMERSSSRKKTVKLGFQNNNPVFNKNNKEKERCILPSNKGILMAIKVMNSMAK
jgi:hypothetical protein